MACQAQRVRKMLDVLRLLILCVAFTLASCGVADAPVPLSEGQAFPQFTLAGLNGGTTSPQAFRGKLLVLNVWATWCHPCRQEMPSLDRLSRTVDPRRMAVVGLSVDDDKRLAQEFILQYQVTFPIFIDTDMRIANRILGIKAFPATFLIAPDGKLVGQIFGEREWDSPAMMRLLEEAYRGKTP